jgi:hypothetical protein
VCPSGWVKVIPVVAVSESERKSGVSISLKEPTQLHKNGVIIERDKLHADYASLSAEEKVQRKIFCMVTKDCRESGICVKISAKANSAAVAHVKLASHKECVIWDETKKEVTSRKNTDRITSRIAATLKDRDATVFSGDSKRYYILNAVKDLIIGRMLPFSYWESDDVKHHYGIVNPEFPIESLHNKAVKHVLLEFYAHLTASIKSEVTEAKSNSTRAFIIANLDLWTSKVSKGVYIGK